MTTLYKNCTQTEQVFSLFIGSNKNILIYGQILTCPVILVI